MGRRRAWTDDELRAAVTQADSMTGVIRILRGSRGAGYEAVKRRVLVLDLDTSHFKRPFAPSGGSVDPRRWTDEELAVAVATASSLNQVFHLLGLVVGGSQWLI